MNKMGIALTIGLVIVAAPRAGAQRPAVTVDDDDITIRGCITEARSPSVTAPSVLVWSRSDIMLAAAEALHEPASLTGRVFYWLEDDEDLAKHLGKRVEITGELEDFEKGKVKIERDDGYTKVKLELDGKTEEARVPTAWLSSSTDRRDDDQEVKIVVRRIDVDDIKVLGDCR
jgi:hypothetical protein